MLGEAADRDAEAEGREHLHHADIGLGPHGMADDRKIDEGAEHEHDADDEWRGEHRIERGCRDDAESRVHGEHQELAMGEIHHVHEAEDQ